MKHKLTIAVDIDDVLAPHSEILIKWYNLTYGARLTLADSHPADNDFKLWGTDDMYSARRRVHKFFEKKEFINTNPYIEVVEVLRVLCRSFNLVVVTSRDYMVEGLTQEWLDKHFKGMFSSIYFTARYSVEGKTRSKADACLEAGANYLIDDSLEETREASAKGIKSLLFGDYPWNQVKKLPKGVVRVKNWQKVLEYFNEQGR